MRILDKLMGTPPEVSILKETAKTGEQGAKLADPQGKRVYYETFVDEPDQDKRIHWTARVYDAQGLCAEKKGNSSSQKIAQRHATEWAAKTRQAILEQAWHSA